MRKRHVPMRTCVGCRQARPKRELIRIVRNPEGEVEIDLTGKKSGRGVYICPEQHCLEQAVRERQIERALQTKIGPELLDKLKTVLENQDQ